MGQKEDNHLELEKPVTFYAPLISGLLVVIILLIIISLFNPKPHSSEHRDDVPLMHNSTSNNESGVNNTHPGDNH